MKQKRLIILVITGIFTMIFSKNSYSLLTEHPLDIFDRGMKTLNSYRGEATTLYEAEKVFSKLLEQFPDSPFGYLGLSRVYKIDAYRHGRRYDMQKIREEALPFAIKALELGPTIKAVHENYSHLEEIFERFDLDQRKIKEHIFLHPDSPETYFKVANFIQDQNEYEKALLYYQEALNLNPADSLRLKILKRIAHIYLNEYQQPLKAIEYYQKALEIQMDSAVLNEYLGLAYFKAKNYKSAIERLSKSLSLVKLSMPEYHLMQAKGYLAEEEGKIEEAINFLEKASVYGEKNSDLHFKLGNLYYNIANYESAFKHFQKVIALNPQEAYAYYYAGRSAYSLGNTETAISFYKRYLQLRSDSQEADWIRKNIPEFSQK